MSIRSVAGRASAELMHGARLLLNRFPFLKPLVRRVLGTLPTALRPSQLGDVAYQRYVDATTLTDAELAIQRDAAGRLAYQPEVSVLVAVYDPVPAHLRECVASVVAQTYPRWELILVDDASPDPATRVLLAELSTGDGRIVVAYRDTNGGISRATNDALALATGEYACVLDHDDLLQCDALFRIVADLGEHPGTDLVYTDEDRGEADGSVRLAPHFKPDWNPDLLLSANYITHLACWRTSLVRDLGGFDPELDGAQDWDLLLRIGQVTDRIRHVPAVAYTWRMHGRSTSVSMDTKPHAMIAQRKVVFAALDRAGDTAAVVVQDPLFPSYWKVTHDVVGSPVVSIVIPSKDSLPILRRCIESLYAKTVYPSFEIVLVDTGSTDVAVEAWYAATAARHDTFRVLRWSGDRFSYAESCNFGAAQARGEILVMLNNDTEIIEPAWLDLLVGEAQVPQIGAVGCLLVYPDRTIQHAGISLGIGAAIAVNTLGTVSQHAAMSIGQHMMAHTRHDVSAVTAACLALRREVFEQVGGFDPAFRVTYNDVDLCLRIGEAGYRILYTPYVRLVHHEGLSVGRTHESARDQEELRSAQRLFAERWPDYLRHDPFRNPNLSGGGPKLALVAPTR